MIFTVAYSFAAKPIVMDMDFPHKSIGWAGQTKVATLDAILADAVARQSTSRTAFLMMSPGNDRSVYEDAIESRIKYFAGDVEDLVRKTKVSGCFWRDHWLNDDAGKKDESAVNLGNSANFKALALEVETTGN